MVQEDISRDVKQFILDRIDSVELLEVLFLLRSKREKEWNAQTVSRELRANPESIANRLVYLTKLGLVKEDRNQKGKYYYEPENPSAEKLIDTLAETYKLRPTKVLELIFTPGRTVMTLASAFDIMKKGADHG